jgi:protein SCO1/2
MMRAVFVTLAVAVGTSRYARAELAPPPAQRQIGLTERAGEQVPRDLMFSDADGRRIRLGDLFDDRPVLLVLSYIRCSMLCSLVLRGAVQAIAGMDLVAGEDYRIVTVSIDPSEEAAAAAARRRDLLDAIGHPGQTWRWTYLVGATRPIRALADSLGFHYTWDERTEQFAHPAVIFVLTPDGRISRYLRGIQYEPEVVAGALRDAARGQVFPASAIAEAVMNCFRFDPTRRLYRERIRTYLRSGATAVLSVLA